MSKEQTPIEELFEELTREGVDLEYYLGSNVNYYLEQEKEYAQAKVLEALERDRTNNLKHIQEDYKCSVCGNSEFEQK